MPAVAPLFTWTGFHLGGSAGHASGRSSLGGLTGPFAPYLGGGQGYRLSDGVDGFTCGAHLGYNHQFRAASGVVVGVEADIDYNDLAPDPALPGGPATRLASYRDSLDGIGAVRARAG